MMKTEQEKLRDAVRAVKAVSLAIRRINKRFQEINERLAGLPEIIRQSQILLMIDEEQRKLRRSIKIKSSKAYKGTAKK